MDRAKEVQAGSVGERNHLVPLPVDLRIDTPACRGVTHFTSNVYMKSVIDLDMDATDGPAFPSSIFTKICINKMADQTAVKPFLWRLASDIGTDESLSVYSSLFLGLR
jgi:hypothetical protein